MTLEGHADLHNAPAQNNQAHRADQAEDEVRKIVDNGDRVIRGEGRGG